jgi:LuxR family transcriptional regulator, maltose regulon positive regulatory protein
MATLTPLMIDALNDEQLGPTEIDVHVRVDPAHSRLHVQVETCRVEETVPLSLRLAPLTDAERRVLPYLATNLATPEQLHLSRHTVKSHTIRIYRKLGVSCRNEAVQEARRLGLLARYAVLQTVP